MINPTQLVFTVILAYSTVSSAAAPVNGLVRRDYDAAGWHRRAEPHPAGSSYHIDKQNLAFGLGRSTRLEPEGFTVAFFKPNVAIDAMGKVLKVKVNDFTTLTALAKRNVNLPVSDVFGNLWSVEQPVSDLPIDRLSVVSSSPDDQFLISVYGHDGKTKKLEVPVGNYTQLPEDLNKILTLGKEARDGYVSGEEDVAVVHAANAVLRKP